MAASREWWTPPQVSQDLQCGVSTVYRWIESGALQAVNVSSGEHRARYRVAHRALQDFLQQRTVCTQPKRPRKYRARVSDVQEFV